MFGRDWYKCSTNIWAHCFGCIVMRAWYLQIVQTDWCGNWLVRARGLGIIHSNKVSDDQKLVDRKIGEDTNRLY